VPDDEEEAKDDFLKMILIVDDSAPNRKMLSRILRNSGYECDGAEDGVACLEKFVSVDGDANAGTVIVFLSSVRMRVVDEVKFGSTSLHSSLRPQQYE
jgi:CheY-like chemotaxis protein